MFRIIVQCSIAHICYNAISYFITIKRNCKGARSEPIKMLKAREYKCETVLNTYQFCFPCPV